MSLHEKIQHLYSQFGTLPGITIELHKDLIAINSRNKQASATVFLQGAQLSHYQRHGEQPIIWCSDHCDYKAGTSLRGGIPICWPWFGDLDKNPQQVQQHIDSDLEDIPSHGFVRTREWQLSNIDIIDENTTKISLEISFLTDQEPLWPYACKLQLHITIGAELRLQLTTINHSALTLNYSAAMHSYFAVSDISKVCIEGLEQTKYLDCLDYWTMQQQDGKLFFNGEVDRLYQTSDKPILIQDDNRRTMTIINENSHSSVVWNPWINKSKTLSNFADDDYQRMLCVETANAGEDFVTLAPQQQHCLQLTIS